MDTRPLAAPEAPAASVRNNLRFEGSTSEYFKIWIVNIALTIVTLGIFSAWAKVRSKRYFCGNTYIGTDAFDYHAPPLRILLGRAIAAALLLGYFFTTVTAPKAVGGWFLLFFFALPWLIKSSLRFNARNTSYRNVRFDFHGTYWGAFKAFVLWQGLAIITLFTTLPFSHRARDYYNVNNHSFGQAAFKVRIPVGKLYFIYLLVPLFLIVAAIPVAIIAFTIAGEGFRPTADHELFISLGMASFWYWYIAAILTIPAFIGALIFNLVLNNMRMGEDFGFESHLSPGRMTWIVVSNLVLTLVTLGLLYPWARVRRARYMANCIAVIGPANIENFTSAPVSGGSAVGEEIAGFFDLDFGL